MKFSQRMGKKSVRTRLQTDSMDSELRSQLWNVIVEKFEQPCSDYQEHDNSEIFKEVWRNFLYLPIDELPYTDKRIDEHEYDGGYSIEVVDEYAIRQAIKEWYFKTETEWYDIYDLLEFMVSLLPQEESPFVDSCNSTLKKFMSGYRVIGGLITPINSEEEILSIEEALATADKWDSVQTHLESALSFLSDRKNPDFRNSIKESISAVESLCKIITKNDKATLGDALKEIEKIHKIPESLKKAFSSIYGYTSDSGGIRHSLKPVDVEIKLEDAKLILVFCSAFINYLKMKISA